MKLKTLVERLENLDQDHIPLSGFGEVSLEKPDSNQVKFRPQNNVSIGEMLSYATSIVDQDAECWLTVQTSPTSNFSWEITEKDIEFWKNTTPDDADHFLRKDNLRYITFDVS